MYEVNASDINVQYALREGNGDLQLYILGKADEDDYTGFPKIINDEEVVPLYVSKGATFAEALDYAVSGCTEARMPNRDTYTSGGAYINFAAAVEMVLRNGRMKKYGSELLGLETDDSLVERYVIEDRAEAVLAIGRRNGQFDSLGYCDAERAETVGIGGEDVLAGTRTHGRARRHLSAVGLHHAATVRLLLVAYFDHVYGQFDAELPAGICKGGTPLTGAGLCGDVRHALVLAIPSLCQGRIELVRTNRADAFVLEIYVRGRVERLLKGVGTYQRRTTPFLILLSYLVGNRNPFVCLIEFLIGACLIEDRVEILGLERLAGLRGQERLRLCFHIGLNVIPCCGYILFFKQKFLCFAHINDVYNRISRQI